MLQKEFQYVVEPTGADCPSQNGAAEINNDKLVVKVRTLLYGSGLPAKFWSTALLHSVYLHNRLVHSSTKMTPYEAWYGRQPDVSNLRTFGSRVCVKAPGTRRCKLDRHDYTLVYFLGIQQLTKILSTSIQQQASSKQATTQHSTKHGTSNLHGLPLHSSYMISALKPTFPKTHPTVIKHPLLGAELIKKIKNKNLKN